jgi:RND superfamily putative drug exporter
MLIGLLTLPGYRPSYNDQKFIPQDIPGSQGYNAAARHFPESKMTTPDILLIESDHDMRNSADFLILNKLAKAIFAVPGISNVQSVTRPEGKAIDHTSIPYMLSWTQANQQLFLPFQKARMADMLQQAEDMSTMIALMRHMQDLMTQMVQTTHHMVGSTHAHWKPLPRSRPPRGFRRFLPADPQLFLLGAALLRHSHLLVDQVDFRCARRYQPGHR